MLLDINEGVSMRAKSLGGARSAKSLLRRGTERCPLQKARRARQLGEAKGMLASVVRIPP